jgi:hypothetical protein
MAQFAYIKRPFKTVILKEGVRHAIGWSQATKAAAPFKVSPSSLRLTPWLIIPFVEKKGGVLKWGRGLFLTIMQSTLVYGFAIQIS